MSSLLAALYPWTKSLHAISVIAWMAALFYLPRLFVYHCGVPRGSAESERFKIMERRLHKQIMNPAMHLTWSFGILLVVTPGVVSWWPVNWWHFKFIAALGMTGFHIACSRWRRAFLEDRNRRSHHFYRVANEVPTFLMVLAVIMVIAKPF
ncbi:MAG: protoporphyrinogen oxidase HemJ [Acetobacteraceae bacterium]|nr:protoporphyrinogen oxidase HemJ [Acetobacteraceae bacterium]